MTATLSLDDLRAELTTLEAQLRDWTDQAQLAVENVKRLSGAIGHTRGLIARLEAPPVPDFSRLGEALFYAAKRERRKTRKELRRARSA